MKDWILWHLSDSILRRLAQVEGAAVHLATVGGFTRRKYLDGWHTYGQLAKLSHPQGEFFIHNHSEQSKEGEHFGVLGLQSAPHSSDQVASELDELGVVLSKSHIQGSSHIHSLSVIQDDVAWKERSNSRIVHASCHVGLLFGLKDGNRLLVLCKNSDAGVLQFGFTHAAQDLSWWSSFTSIKERWMLDDDQANTEGVDILQASRVITPLFSGPKSVN